jgi:hypothetical protein
MEEHQVAVITAQATNSSAETPKKPRLEVFMT